MERRRRRFDKKIEKIRHFGAEISFEMSRRRHKNKNKKLKLLALNVAGILNKKKHFWNYVEDYEIICLSDTWLEAKDNDYMKTKF